MGREEKMITSTIRLTESVDDWIKNKAKAELRSKSSEILSRLIELKKQDEQNAAA